MSAPISGQRPPTDRDGVSTSACVFQPAGGTGNTGNLQMNAYASPAAAAAGLTKYVDAMVKLGATTEPDTVAGLTAAFVTTKRGSGEMYVVKGSVLLGAGVSGLGPDHKTVQPSKDRSRALLAAALSKL